MFRFTEVERLDIHREARQLSLLSIPDGPTPGKPQSSGTNYYSGTDPEELHPCKRKKFILDWENVNDGETCQEDEFEIDMDISKQDGKHLPHTEKK